MSVRTRIALVAAVAALSLAVAVAPASAGTLDQEQTTFNNLAVIQGSDAPPPQSLAQTFTAGLSGALDQVDLYLGKVSPVGPVTVELRDVSIGAPGSSVLASASVGASNVPSFTSPAFVAVPFAAPAQVTAGSQYAIVAYTGGIDQYGWGYGSGNVYPAGDTFFTFSSPPTTWTLYGGTPRVLDLAFKTYVVPPTQPPAVLINELIQSVAALNLPKGTANGLQSKLTGAQKNLATGDIAGTCNKLASFIAQVTALRDKKIVPASAANALITEAETVRDELNCG